MSELPTSLWLGLLLVGGCALILNIFVLITIVRSPLLTRKGQPVFIHIFSMLMGKTMQLMLIVFYITPSIIFQHHPFADHEHGMLIHSLVSYLFYTFWVHSCCSNTVLAFSRFVKIICPASRLSSLCTGRTSICIQALAVWLCSGLLALTTQFLLSCCRVQIDHHSYGYSYVRDEDAFNYSKYYVNLPANIIHTVIFCLFYASIIVFLWRHRMPIGSASRREFELAIQFLCIAAFFSLTWISFNILPTTRLRSLPATVMLEFDCAAAALIYLTMNRDIRRYLSKTDDRKNSQSGSNFRKTTIHMHCSSRRLRPAPAAVSL